ncbi:glycosyltransferase [Pseudomonas sp. N040]|uniref:glycosyltransferase n=1 Tax=Pseudomonas sp. N040 TaxID=2785325 RepID=UPI0018A2D6A9|nr:glycosyltransferase [Pseudomonas sp. N040]MBF7728982.1 glycosyltransferase [Pseudomonas sp. N040]MBW7012622.1 glycosyltransferase [Pseudomonas sp. N040]
MIILVGSKIDQSSIRSSLGKPEYSYFFLMKDFLPVLERLGTVRVVESLEEIAALSERYRAEGEQVVFLSFTPPQQAPLAVGCPTIVVFAWEFDRLPDLPWGDNPQNDWRYVFQRVAGTISTSREAAELVSACMPAAFPVLACPAPVWNRFADLGEAPTGPDLASRSFSFQGILIDSALLGLSADGLVRKPEPEVEPEPVVVLEPEPEPAVQELPPSRWRETWLTSGALLRGWWREVWRGELPSVQALPVVELPPSAPAEQPPAVLGEAAEPFPVSVAGVVYVSVLNPADNRKNWVEIVTAFCWAFKDKDDATLVLKMTHHDLDYYRIVLITLLSRLAPFKCRVVVLHGFLQDEQYRELIRASTFYINASSGEGLCLPLMEFLSAGRPAIAPLHTAMADYMSDELGFVIRCSPEPFCWPHDPARIFTTHRQRLNWESLMRAFEQSYRQARTTPQDYRQMAANASQRMREFASVEALQGRLGGFIEQVLAAAGAPGPAARDEGGRP